MAFRVYKPKNLVKVRAEQVTLETVEDLADRLMGRVVKKVLEHEVSESVTHDSAKIVGLEVPTFDGTKLFEIGTWVVKSEDNTLSKMRDEEFHSTYEQARNTNGS